MKKLGVILFLGILVACSGDAMGVEENEKTEPKTVETHVNDVNTDNETDEKSNADVPTENTEPANTNDLENQEVISGIIELIDNNRFEIYEYLTQDGGDSDEDLTEMADYRTVIVIDDSTTFEIVQGDGVGSILDRWEATASDLSEDRSVEVTGHRTGTEFLATHIIIWQFPWN